MPVVINGSTGISGVDGSAGTPAFQGSDTNTGIRFGTDIVSLVTNGSDRLYIDSSGKLGVGTSSPAQSWTGGASQVLQLQGPAATITVLRINESGGTYGDLQLVSSGSAEVGVYNFSNGAMRFGTNGTERLRIDSSGRVGIGTTTPRNTLDVNGTIYVTGGNQIQITGSGGTTGLQLIGQDAAESVIGTMSSQPLVFRTNAAERARIISSGFFKASNTGNYQGAAGTYHEFRTDLDDQCLYLHGTNGAWNNHLILGRATQAASTSYKFILFQSGNGADTEYNLRGDGNAFADGTWTGGGADYAEYFEWADSNPNEEDRRGISVVLDGDKIREAAAGEEPIGVVSGNPSVVGDAAWNKWSGKYLRDDFGTYIQEDYEVVNDDGETVVQQRRKLNPAYEPDVEYIPREDRPEWDCVGLMGKLRIRKGQVTGARWIKMRDISATVEEWLVR